MLPTLWRGLHVRPQTACPVGIWLRSSPAKRRSFGCSPGYEVVAWTEAGVVGLAFQMGWGPIEQLDLPIDAEIDQRLSGPTESNRSGGSRMERRGFFATAGA